MKPGDVAIIFTPDDTHYNLSAACIAAGLHVLVAKPIVKTLQEHKGLVELANKQNVLVSREGPTAEVGDAFWGWGHPTSS
jgi:D-galacturonate reductase